MLVGVVGPAAEDDFASNILAGLEQMGLRGVSLGAATPALIGPRSRALAQVLRRDPRLGPSLESRLVRAARLHKVDVVITVVSLRPETVRALRAIGCRVALWFPDHVANLGALWMFDAPYNGLFFKEPALVRRVNAMLDLPVHYLAEACNPAIHRPTSSSNPLGKVVVVGNLHPMRARLLERLAADGVPLAIYGDPAQATLHRSLSRFHTGSYVRGLRKSEVFGGAAAVLNSLHPAEMEGMNCRLFEATAAGGMVVSEHRPELDRLFRVGTEVLAFRSYCELLGHLDRLLAEPKVGRDLGTSASERCLRDYTYARRLAPLLELIA